ncbi:MAG: hypothetical protein JO061_06585, partial [Acidobacteriaceae bacterium]|nr:hypothetical protein [Acidobacteriaceae bacterium]
MSALIRGIIFGLLSLTASGASWELGPFARPRDAQPIITPDKNATFHDPVSGEQVHW